VVVAAMLVVISLISSISIAVVAMVGRDDAAG
jgi:hypothetical protein